MTDEPQNINYFFVDEAGDPTFYDRYKRLILDKDGCSKILLLGLIRTNDPQTLRKRVLALQEEIKNDKYFENIPSVKKTIQAFHATDDIPEIREKFYKLIINLDFKAEFIVARKIESVFINRHKKNENVFYDDLIVKLFENKLHKTDKNIIYFSARGSKTRQAPLSEAIQTAVLTFETKWKKKVNSDIKIYAQRPTVEPCLQIIDYMSWAVQRAFVKGEDRYLKFVNSKISYLCDVYDFKKYPKNYYNSKNQFDLTKISPL